MANIIETRRLPNGQVIRIQRRRGAFDVIRNSTGLCWMYVEKAVTERRARNTFDRLCLV